VIYPGGLITDIGAPTSRCEPAGNPLPFSDLSESGLLWLINRVVFHPRGFALQLAQRESDGEITGWRLAGDGSGAWRMDGDEPEFAAAEATFEAARADPVPG
jgi:hypothetical protein